MDIRTAAYAAIRSGLSDEQSAKLLDISENSIRAYRAHVTMGNDVVEGQHIKSVRFTAAEREAILDGKEVVLDWVTT